MIRNFTEDHVPDQAGKTFFITGANTGIGFETAKVLAARGARVLLGCRSRSKAEDAVARILAEQPDANLEIVDLDLGDLASVRAAAATVAQEPRLDALINNAGIMVPPKELTTDGFESQFGVNHLGHFALTSLLLPTLDKTDNARIVCTSSIAHKGGKIDFDDPHAERSYSAMGRYSTSKMANLLHMYELDRRLKATGSTTIAVSAHPGVTDTDLSRHMGVLKMFLPVARLMLNTPLVGARSTMAAATAPEVQGGQYFGPSGFREMIGPVDQVDSTTYSKDPAIAKRLWDLSIELTGVDPQI